MNWLNKKISNYCINHYKKKNYRKFDKNLFPEIKEDGLYLVFLYSKNYNIVSRAIEFFSGSFSHIVLAWNGFKLSDLTSMQRAYLTRKILFYYKNLDIDDFKKIDNLVLASMDDIGAQYFDLGTYNRREKEVIKLNLTKEQEFLVIHRFLSLEIMNKTYDFTGLTFWWVNRMLDDESAFYCSEIYYEEFKKLGIKVCDKEEPSPTQIYRYLSRDNLLK